MEAYLIYDTPYKEPHLFHWGHFWTPDPMLALKINDKTIAVVSNLEYGRCLSESTFNEVFLWADVLKLTPSYASTVSNFEKIIMFLQKRYTVDTFVIPSNFPAELYEQLTASVPIKLDGTYFQTQRQFKSTTELESIRRSCQLTSASILHARKILKQSQVGAEGKLYHHGKQLTSEYLRQAIECFCLKHNGRCEGTIVSGALQAANPHCEGSGPLYAHTLIVIDVFPRHCQSGYYGDMTRTFLKGTPTAQQEQLYTCVKLCQKEVIKRIRPGVNAKDLMQYAQNFFKNYGFDMLKTKSGVEGFIHGLGHGVGLALHEYPSIGNTSIILEPNMVFTVEPGLYYRTLGGVRIEDVVQVTDTGCQLLSRCPYTWIV